MNEVELIDLYLDALNRNPKANPPQGLNAKTAAFVQALWLSEQPQDTTSELEAAIWQKALQAAESQKMADAMTSLPISRNGTEQPVNVTQSTDYLYVEKNAMLPSKSLTHITRRRSGSLYGLSSLVAAVLVLVLGGLLVLEMAQRKVALPYVVALQQATPTPIPLEKITPENITQLTQLYTIKLAEDTPVFTAVAFTPDGKYLVYGNGTNNIDFWNIATRQVERKFANPYRSAQRLAFSFSKNGELLAVLGETGNTIWDLSGSKDAILLPYDADVVGGAQTAFSSDGKTLYSIACTRANDLGCSGDVEYAWDTRTGKRSLLIKRASGLIADLDISPAADLAAYGFADGRLLTRTLTTGLDEKVFQYEGTSIILVGFSPDGTLLFTGNNDGMVQIWNVADGEAIFKQKIADKTHSLGWTALSPDNALLVSASVADKDRNLYFWDLKNQKFVTQFRATDVTKDPFISQLGFSPDGKLFVSLSNDHILRVWGVVAGS
jgi:WD40 repeat protein